MQIAVKESPILMNGDMVRATLAGRKTQTRRLVKPQPTIDCADRFICWRRLLDHWMTHDTRELNPPPVDHRRCPCGSVGDRLWVRETFADHNPFVPDDIKSSDPLDHVLYCATDADPREVKWTPSIHMPRWACRLVLEITDVRVERVQDISEEDAINEGVLALRSAEWDAKHFPEYVKEKARRNRVERPPLGPSPRQCFAKLWDSLYGNWRDNPWVWAVTFKRIVEHNEFPEVT